MRISFIAVVLVFTTLPGFATAFAQRAPQRATGSSLRTSKVQLSAPRLRLDRWKSVV